MRLCKAHKTINNCTCTTDLSVYIQLFIHKRCAPYKKTKLRTSK